MNKEVLLLLHLFPREIDDFDNLANQLKVAAKYIQELKVDANIILNLNPELIDWEGSLISQDFIISKFEHIITKFNWCRNLLVEVSSGTKYWGYLEQRVQAPKVHSDYDGYLLLDPDLILDDYVFYGLENTLNTIQDSEFIISAQMYKFWDSSWDIISYDKRQYSFDVDEFDPYTVKTLPKEQINILSNKQIKFAGGWFNYISAPLYKTVEFPEGVKGYGPEDTFIALQATKRGATQYIMEGIVVQENRKYLNNKIYAEHIQYKTDKLKEINIQTKALFNLF